MGQQIDLLQFPRVHREIGTRTDEHRAIARLFDKEFFDGGRLTGYGGYVNDGRWIAVAHRLIKHYRLRPADSVLDVGCAKGFLVEALRAQYLDAYGADVSWYAISCASIAIRPRMVCVPVEHMHFGVNEYRLIVSINTLHNLERDDLVMTLRKMEAANAHCYITVDAYRTPEEKERMFAWNLTAKTILHVDEWLMLFAEAGYTGDYDWFIP